MLLLFTSPFQCLSVAAAGSSEADTTSNTTLPDGKTSHNVSLLGNIHTSGMGKNGRGGTGGNPCKHWGKAANGEWQPVGDSNPCDGTENPGVAVDNNNNSNDLQEGNCKGTSKGTAANAETSQIDGIRAALAGLSRDEIITLLADVLAHKPHDETST